MSDVPLTPLPGQLFIRREVKTHFGNIILPDTAHSGKTKLTATVEAVGPGIEGFEPGDMVLLASGAGRTIGKDRQTVSPSEILAVVRDAEEGDLELAGGAWEIGALPDPEFVQRVLASRKEDIRYAKEQEIL